MHDDTADVLLEEMNHRFFNSLQTICSASNAFLTDLGTQRDQVVQRFQERIASLAAIHRLLARADEADGGELPSAFGSLCFELATSFDVDPRSLVVRVSPVRLGTARLRLLLMLAAELVLNALKHGLVDVDHRAWVELEPLSDGASRLRVINQTPREAPSGRPFVALRLAAALGGTMSVSWKNGCAVEVVFA